MRILVFGSGQRLSVGSIKATAILIAGVVLPFIGLSSGQASAAPPTAPSGQEWVIDWQDEFDGAALDDSNWITCRTLHDPDWGCKGATAPEEQWYESGQVSVSGGNLRLTADRQFRDDQCQTEFQCGPGQVQDYDWVSGLVSTGIAGYFPDDIDTDSKKLFSPGIYIEGRIRVPTGLNYWPAMWLLPKNPEDSTLPEIDIVEMFGDQHTASSNYHIGSGSCSSTSGSSGLDCPGELDQSGESSTYFADDYHMFGVNWQTDKLEYYIDGQLIHTVTGTIPNEQMHLIMNLAVGGFFGASGDNTQTPAPATMLVDYVRAYVLAAAPEAAKPECSEGFVSCFTSPVTGKETILEVDDSCAVQSATVAEESNTASDPQYRYPLGLMDFELDCATPGFTTSVTQYYFEPEARASEYILRKSSPGTGEYFTIENYTLTDATIDGRAALVATYDITDGGELDADGQVNGQISDPAGPALVLGAPDTGLPAKNMIFPAVAASMGLMFVLSYFRLGLTA